MVYVYIYYGHMFGDAQPPQESLFAAFWTAPLVCSCCCYCCCCCLVLRTRYVDSDAPRTTGRNAKMTYVVSGTWEHIIHIVYVYIMGI